MTGGVRFCLPYLASYLKSGAPGPSSTALALHGRVRHEQFVPVFRVGLRVATFPGVRVSCRFLQDAPIQVAPLPEGLISQLAGWHVYVLVPI